MQAGVNELDAEAYAVAPSEVGASPCGAAWSVEAEGVLDIDSPGILGAVPGWGLVCRRTGWGHTRSHCEDAGAEWRDAGDLDWN